MENVTHTPKYEVVFFDLYGTLIDIRTDEQCDAAWQALYDTACELGAQYDSVEALRERFEKLEAREMLHQSNHAIVRNGWDEFDVLPVAAHESQRRGGTVANVAEGRSKGRVGVPSG